MPRRLLEPHLRLAGPLRRRYMLRTLHSTKLSCIQGVNVTALREIKLLRELRSPNVVQLLDVFAHKRKNLQLVSTSSARWTCIATSLRVDLGMPP